jgi:DNA-binding transcriptional MerR regulator
MSKHYRVKDVEKLIDRDKTTLFRWEKEGKINPPRRDSRGWRLYTEEDLEKMKAMIKLNVNQYSS